MSQDQFSTAVFQDGSFSGSTELHPCVDATAATKRQQVFMLLHGRYLVHREIYDCVRYQLGDVCHFLDPRKTYKASQLCGDGFWSQLSRAEGKVAGSCLAQMVKNGTLPLAKVSASGRYPNRYELT